VKRLGSEKLWFDLKRVDGKTIGRAVLLGSAAAAWAVLALELLPLLLGTLESMDRPSRIVLWGVTISACVVIVLLPIQLVRYIQKPPPFAHAVVALINRLSNTARSSWLKGNWRLRLVIALAAGLTCATAFYFWSPREPRYGGHSLTQWVEPLHDFKGEDAPSILLLKERRRVAGQALRHMGDAVYPCLFDWVRAGAPAWRAKCDRSLATLQAKRWPVVSAGAGFIRGSLGHVSSSRSPAVRAKHRTALRAFSLLGTNAWPAVPGLLALAQEQDPGVRRSAYACLGYVRLQPQSLIPFLTPLLGHTNQAIRSEAQAYLWEHYRDELEREGFTLTYVMRPGLNGANMVLQPTPGLRPVRTNVLDPLVPTLGPAPPKQ
jgi:hypothetical protein